MEDTKYSQILEKLLRSIKNRDGGSKIQSLQNDCKDQTMEGTKRETLVQILSRERWWRRFFLVLYPELLIPYLFRIRKVKKKKR